MPMLKVNDFKRYLNTKTTAELKAELVDLFKTFKNVKEFYAAKLQPDTEADIASYYKKIIENEFAIRSSGQVSLKFSVMRKAIADFQKVARDPQNVVELMMTVVEEGIGFTLSCGDISAGFYNSLATMFRKEVQYILENNLVLAFQDQCLEAVEASRDIGWGFGDEMAEIYEGGFPPAPQN